MKNILIVVLMVALGVVGLLLYSKEDSKDTTTDGDASQLTTTPLSGETIDLSGRNLERISTDIFDNSKVRKLDVSNNALTGALPAEIRKLANLEVLIAANNSMSGIPAEIGQLTKLKIADFSNNKLSGLPLEIGNLKNLETLDLRGNPDVSTYDLNQIASKIPQATILTD